MIFGRVEYETISDDLVETSVRFLQKTNPDLYGDLADSDTGKTNLNDDDYGALWDRCKAVLRELEVNWSRFDLKILTTRVRLKVAEENGVILQVSKTSWRNETKK